jgi:DNA-binding response OmpR family regulator
MQAAAPASILIVGSPSPALHRKQSLLQNSGFDTTIAESICHAEVFAESQYFDAAIYDDSLPEHEQISLAHVMRIRWPWIRLISCGASPGDGLFDANQASESQLPETLKEILT